MRTDPLLKYDKIYSQERYSDELPHWVDVLSTINWSTMQEAFLDVVAGVVPKIGNRINVIDIGCGDGAFIGQVIEMCGPCLQPTNWVFLDGSKLALERTIERADACFKDSPSHSWSTMLADINDASTWFRLLSETRYDIAVCHGVTVHIDDITEFLEGVAEVSDNAIIEFMRGDSRLARTLADDDFVKNGFEYNIWNPRLIEKYIGKSLHKILDWQTTDLSHIITTGRC